MTPKRSLVEKMAATYELEPKAFLSTMKTTVFPLAETNEQLMALLVVADQYQLNPFLRGELYAFPQQGGVVPVVGGLWQTFRDIQTKADAGQAHYRTPAQVQARAETQCRRSPVGQLVTVEETGAGSDRSVLADQGQ